MKCAVLKRVLGKDKLKSKINTLKPIHMKANRLIIYTILLVNLNSCKEDEETRLQRTDRLLKSTTWKISKLTIDGTDQTAEFDAMRITFATGTYTSEAGEPVWPTSGTWLLNSDTSINRGDGIMITIPSIEENRLTLAFEWDKKTLGERNSSIKGSYLFELTPEN
jgi:hypothetical protein